MNRCAVSAYTVATRCDVPSEPVFVFRPMFREATAVATGTRGARRITTAVSASERTPLRG